MLSIITGTLIVGFNPNRWDYVVMDLPRGSHGIHLHDIVGVAFVALGTAIFWRASVPARGSR